MVFRRKMEAGADKSESQLAEGKWSYHVPRQAVYRVKHIASTKPIYRAPARRNFSISKLSKLNAVIFAIKISCRQNADN